MKHRGVCLLVYLLLLVAGCGSPSEKSTDSATEETKRPSLPDGVIQLKPEDVETNGLRSVEVVESRIAPSLVVPARVRVRSGGEAEIFSPFPGRLVGESTLPRVGQAVVKGQHLADVEQQFAASEKLQIATTAVELQTSIAQAEQEVNLKRTEVNRAQELYDGGAIPLKQLQTAQFELKQAESKLDGARRSKEQYDAAQSTLNTQPRQAPIRAPMTGTVIAVDATLGQQVDPAKSLLKIADLSTAWVEAAVHERDLSKVRQVRDAEIAAPGAGGAVSHGNLVTIGNAVDPQNRTVPVIFVIDNRAAQLKIDMSVEARIPTGPARTALLIPSTALLSQENGYAVYVETTPGTYQRRTIEIGQRQNNTVVVVSGLQRGEKVVAVGAQTLRSESLKGEIPADDDDKDKSERKR